MHIVIDEIDGAFYADIVLSPQELKRVSKSEMVNGEIIFKRRRCYVGLRLQGTWDYDEEETRQIED
jgi:hypothetical protein